MFQEKEKMEYFSEMAPDELKNRTWSSIQQEKRKVAKQRRQGLCMVACFAGILLISNVMLQNSTIVKVNDRPISYLNVSVGNGTKDIPFIVSEGRNKRIQGEIPMEINVEGNAHVAVSEGTIRTQENSESSDCEVTELDIEGNTVVLWALEGDSDTIAICTITTETNRYQYVIEQDETGWKLRLKDKN